MGGYNRRRLQLDGEVTIGGTITTGWGGYNRRGCYNWMGGYKRRGYYNWIGRLQ